jgi:hypothetical protein
MTIAFRARNGLFVSSVRRSNRSGPDAVGFGNFRGPGWRTNFLMFMAGLVGWPDQAQWDREPFESRPMPGDRSKDTAGVTWSSAPLGGTILGAAPPHGSLPRERPATF